MPEVPKSLNLNKHPALVPNYSLIQAKNMKLSNDLTRLTNEEGIAQNAQIKEAITNVYGGDGWFIVGVIPTSTELVIFTVSPNPTNDRFDGKIFRYNEDEKYATSTINESKVNNCILVNDQWKWYGGKLKGDYTYNINNHLIVQLAEDPYDREELEIVTDIVTTKRDIKVPLKTFDFDDWDIIKDKAIGICIDNEDFTAQEFVDERKVNNRILSKEDDDTTISQRFGNRADWVNSVVPQVPICNVFWGGLINGNAYKGIYSFFIRYKIDCWGNYTQWYSIGFPITVDDIERNAVSRYNWYYDYDDQDDESGHGYGSIDFYSSKREFCAHLPKIRFKFQADWEVLNFQKYQIGIVIKRNDTTKCFRSDDFDRYPENNGNNALPEYEYIFNREKLVEVSLEELTLDKYNYYNVRNTINYQNRNYISNYTETNYNISEKEIGLFDEGYNIADLFKLVLFAYNPYIRQDPTDDTNNETEEYQDYCVDEFAYDTNLIHGNLGAVGKDKCHSVKSWEKVKGYDYGAWHRIMGGWLQGSHFGVPLYEVIGTDRNKKITVDDDTDFAWKFVLFQRDGRDAFAWWNRNDSRCSIGKVTENGTFINEKTDVNIIVDDKTIYLDGGFNWMSAYSPYLDYKESFTSRAVHKTLIPGEVYSFYVHFVDKYGQSTYGFHIPNTDSSYNYGIDLNETVETFVARYANEEAVPDNRLKRIYAAYQNNPSKWRDYKLYQFINNGGESKTGLVGYQQELGDNILEVGTNTDIKFGYYANNSGNTFHRVPLYNMCNANADSKRAEFRVFGCRLDFNMENPDVDDFISRLKKLGYVGYYLSYEKAEPMSRVVGFCSETDASEDIDDHPTNHDLDNLKDKFKGDYNGDWTYYRGNNNISTGSTFDGKDVHKNIFVYSEDLNTTSALKTDFNAISFRWALFDYRGFWQDQGVNKVAEDRASLNLPEVMVDTTFRDADSIIYPIEDYEILVAAAPNNMDKGTRIRVRNPGVFNKDTVEYNAIATIWSLNNNIYTNPNKELIRINNIRLLDDRTELSKDNIFGAYPGYCTFNSTIVFRRTGARWDPQWTTIKGTDGRRYYALNQGSYNVVSPQRLVQHSCYFHRMFESKQENNRPDMEYFIMNIDNKARFDDEEDTKRIAKLPNDALMFYGGVNVLFPGRPVMPAQTLDMYRYQFPDEVVYDKLLLAYDPNRRNITKYDKTIRRSDIIQDESYVNAWRTYTANNYKIITENKGNIVNLVGIGLYLLAHTEHSMFMFDRTAALQTQNQDVQLLTPDAFDTQYKEVYTSDKGFAGIQDRFAYIIGEFGYIFYNNDFHRIFKFDEKAINYIDDNIYLWLEKELPTKVRFANDKYNNRLLACATIDDTHWETLSYSTQTGTFISAHDYKFAYAYNTKVHNYYQHFTQNTSLQQYTHETNYGRFDNQFRDLNGKNNLFLYINESNDIQSSYIDVIFNDMYETIKFLEYVKYKVKRLDNYLNRYDYGNNIDNDQFPVEEETWSDVAYADRNVPNYSGDIIRIFNEYCDTFNMNVDITNDPNRYNRYKLPYFELGNWNFNYFRNNIVAHPGEISDKLRRIYGNQIVIRFIFKNTPNKRIEFENVQLIVTKQRNVI